MYPLYELACILSLRSTAHHRSDSGAENLRILKAAWSEVGDRCLLALVISNDSLLLRLSIHNRTTPIIRQLPWLASHHITTLCFDPLGIWLLCAASDATLYIIPALSQLDGAAKTNHLWSSHDVTKIQMSGKRGDPPPMPLTPSATTSLDRAQPTSIVWWQTADGQQIAIIGNELGEICFVNLMTKKEVGGTYITVAITTLQLIHDDIQDNVYLLVTGSNGFQWQLLLERPSSNYQWPLEQEIDTAPNIKNFKEYPGEGQPDYQPQRLTNFAGHTHLSPQIVKGRHLITGFYAPTNILSVHTSDLNVVPLSVYKLPVTCDHLVMTDRLMFVGCNVKSKLFVLSNHLAESTIDGKKEFNPDAEIQNFSLPNDERMTAIVKRSSANYTQQQGSVLKLGPQSAPSSPRYSTRVRWPSGSIGPAIGLGTRHSHFQQMKKGEPHMEEHRIHSFTALDGCIIVFETSVYECRPRTTPEHLFLQLVLNQQDPRASERLSASLGLDLNRLYEVAADNKLSQGQFAAAVRLYQLSKCPHARSVANFAAHGCVAELLSYVRVLSFSQGQVEFSLTDKRHFANMELLCYVHQILELKTGTTALAQAFRRFLKMNQHYSEEFAVQLLSEQGMFDMLLQVAMHKGLLFPMAEEILQPQSPSWLDTSTLTCFRERGFGKLLRDIDNESFMHCLMEPKLFVYLLTQPTLLQRHSHFLLPNLTNMSVPFLEKAAQLYDPSRPAARPFLHKALTMKQMSETNLEIWDLIPKEQYPDHIHHLVETFIAILLVLNTSRGFSPFNITFLHSQLDDISDNQMCDSLYQRARLPRRYSPVSCGLTHAAVIRNGEIYTWGKGDKCCLGQGLPRQEFLPPTPLQFFTQLQMRVTAVSCGAYHCLVLTNHGVYGWGSSTYGQVGTGKVKKEPHPVPLETFANEKIVSIACGQYHSMALTDDGRIYTWGWGVHGQLGHGNPNDCFFPCQVDALTNEVVVRVSAGYGHSAVLTAKGDIYTFGCGLFGQLGVGSVNKHSFPQHVHLPEKINLLACGYFHNIAVSASNKIYTWGSNPQLLRSQAQASRKARLQAHLGRGNSTDKTTAEDETTEAGLETGPSDLPKENESNEGTKGPQSHLVPNLLESIITAPITHVACGSHHSSVLTVDGEVFTWGRNLDGQLGNGTRKEQKTPSAVVGLDDYKITHIACGHDFTLAVDADGRLWGWGHNDCGQIGLDVDPANSCSKTIMIKANKRVVQLRNTAQWGIVRPQEVMGLATPHSVFEYEPRLNFEINNDMNEDASIPRGQKLLRLRLPPETDVEELSYSCELVHKIVEVLDGLYKPKQVAAWALQCKNYQVAAKVCRLQKQITESLTYELQALHQLSVGASNVGIVIQTVEFHLKLIEESDITSMKTLLQHTINFWMSERLPVTSLEDFLFRWLPQLAHPLTVLLFCFDDFASSVNRDMVSYVLSRLSSNFCLTLISTVFTQMESNAIYPEFLTMLTSIMQGQAAMPLAEWKALIGNDFANTDDISLSSSELETLLTSLDQDAGFSNGANESTMHTSELVLFSCGHHFTSLAFYSRVLPKFEESMRTQLPYSFHRTSQALLASYREDQLFPMSCPDCVLAAIKEQL